MAEVVTSPDGRVHMLDEAGAPVSIERGELDQALAAGFRPQTPEEYQSRLVEKERSTLGQQALTAAEGFGRGATFGLSEAAAGALLGDEYREAALERKQVNPGLAVGGELAGAVAPVVLSGGTGAVGAAARATPAGLVARGTRALEHGIGHALRGLEAGGLGARAAAGAIKLGASGLVEGAAYGLGTSLADSVLEGTEWTAERALGGLSHGALYGGVIGGGLGAAIPVVGKAGRVVLDRMVGEGRTLKQAVQDFADGRTIKTTVGNDIKTFRRLTEDGAKPERIAETADWLREKQIPLGRGIEETRDALATMRKAEGANMQAVARELDSAGVRVDGQGLLDKVYGRLAGLEESKIVGSRRIARSIRNQIAPLDEAVKKGDDLLFSRLWQDSSFIGDQVRQARRKASPATVQLESLYNDMRATLRDAAEAASPDIVAKWRGAERDYSIASTLWEGARTEAQRQLKNRFVSPSDYGTGLTAALASIATGAGAPASILAGLGTSIAHKFIRERGSSAIGWIADRVAGVEIRAARTARRIAGHAGGLGQRVKAGAEATYMHGAHHGAAYTEGQGPLGKAEATRVARRAGIVGLTAEERQRRYQLVRDDVLAVQRSPETLFARVESAIEPIAREQPEVATAMARRVAADYQWLATKLPKPARVGDGMIGPRSTPVVSRQEEKQLVSYASALADPMAVFDEIAEGKVNFDALDAVKERRPEIFASMQSRVAIEVAGSPAPLPHHQRVFLSVALDLPLDASLAPDSPPVSEPEADGGTPKRQLDAGSFAEPMATPSQSAAAA